MLWIEFRLRTLGLSSIPSEVEVGEVGRKRLYCCTLDGSKSCLRGETLEWGMRAPSQKFRKAQLDL